MKLPRRIKVVERKLGRERAAGLDSSDAPESIFIDPRLKESERLEILLHEALHLLLPDAPEMKIRATSARLQALLSEGRVEEGICSVEPTALGVDGRQALERLTRKHVLTPEFLELPFLGSFFPDWPPRRPCA
jgi:hypothetical protein